MTVTAGAGVLNPLPARTLASPDERAFLSSKGVLNPSLASLALASGGSVTLFCLGCRWMDNDQQYANIARHEVSLCV